MIKLRPFTNNDGYQISKWVTDLDYYKFFRNNSMMPTFEDCCNYPTWSQNLVMMIDYGDKTIGFVNAYQVNHRNRIIHAGCLIDKEYWGNNVGHDSMSEWISYLFNRFGFRKIIVENVDEFLTASYLDCGFTTVGRRKAHCDLFGVYVDEIEMEVFREDFKFELKGQQHEGELEVANGRRK